MPVRMTEQNKDQVVIDKDFFADFPVPSYEEWKEEAVKALKGGIFEKKLLTDTYEGITLQPIYQKKDLESIPMKNTMPGAAPYLRGSKSLGYIKESWLVAQECSATWPRLFNAIAKEELEKGGTALNIILHPAALREQSIDAFGSDCKGLYVKNLADMACALADIDLEKNTLIVNTEHAPLPFFALIMAYARTQGISYSRLKGVIGADPLGMAAKIGEIPKNTADMFDELFMITAWAKKNAAQLQTILVEGHPYSNGGASAVEELAFTLSAAVEYICALQERGLDINEIAPGIWFSFSTGANFFMEIAKLRAARILWAQTAEAFGGNEDAQRMVLHARTASFTKCVYDPYVNLLRTTTETFAGIVGGADSLHVSPFDEPFRSSDEFSRRIARNQQIVLRDECNLRQPVDPAGGSWYIEWLTNAVAEKAWALFQQVQEQGGFIKALEKGFIQSQIDKTLQARYKNLDVRKDVKVGLNMYANMTEKPLTAHLSADALAYEEDQANCLAYPSDLDEQKCAEALSSLQAGDTELVEKSIDAFLCGITLKQYSAKLYPFSEKKPLPKAIKAKRLTEKYESLRKGTEALIEQGENIKVFLINMGPWAQHKARADFSTGFFEVGAFEVVYNQGFASVDEAAEAAIKSDAPAAVICSADPTYPEIVPPLAKMIKAKRPNILLFLAGSPATPELKEAYLLAGVDDFIHVGANCYAILSRIQKKSGVKNGQNS